MSTPTTSMTPAATAEPGLKRSLKLWHLVIYGIVLISPTAALPLFGVVGEKAHGHVVTSLLVAMVAMIFTAISYGRMARAYASAGSAFTYVGRELDPRAGYIVGWSMVMDYLLCPILCTVLCSKMAGNILPVVPYWGWAIIFASVFTGINLRGVQTSARANTIMAAGMSVVVIIMLACIGRYLAAHLSGAGWDYFTKPFYDPATFSFPAVGGGAALAALTYLGFDAISTLSEEVENPRRNILLATVLTCVFTGVFSGLQIYLGQLAWPYGSEKFPDLDTAYVFVAGKAGGPWLMQLVNLTLLVAQAGSGMGAQLAVSRLLYTMGRDEVLPKKFFGVVDPQTRVPANNVLLVGTIALVSSFFLSFQLIGEMMNFGAFIAFVGVNLSALVHYTVRGGDRRVGMWLPPVLGMLICGYLFVSLSWKAVICGSIWMAGGLIYGAWRKDGFKTLRDVA